MQRPSLSRWLTLQPLLWLGLLLFALDMTGTAFAQNSYSISGSVRRDVDSDGDPTDFDTPMAGVIVRLHSDPNSDGDPADGTLLSSTATDLDGMYRFEMLADGSYVVEEVDPVDAVSTFDPSGSLTDNLAAVTVSGGDVFEIDFLDFGVFLFGLSGGVYADGPLMDGDFGSDDSGVAAVQVYLHADLNANGLIDAGDPLLGSAVTATNGRYGFGGLVPGRYVVAEADPPGAVSVNDRQGAPNDNQVGVEITGNDVTNADFLDQNINLAALRGSVRADLAGNGVPDSGNPPLAGVTLLLFTDPNGDGNPFDGNAVEMTATNLAGAYSFTNLPPGHYVVFQFDTQGASSTWDAVGLPTDSMAGATLVASDINNLDFLDAGALTGTASGIIYEDGASQDAAFTPDDTETAGVTVRLYADLDGDGLPSDADILLGETTSVVGGSLAFQKLVYGLYVAQEAPPPGVTVVNVLDGNISKAAIPFELSGSAFQNLFYLNQGLLPASVAGSVRNDLDGDGNPASPDPALPNVPVRLFTDPDGNGDPADGRQIGYIVSNAQGGWQFDGLSSGHYIVAAAEVPGSSSTYDTQGSPTDGQTAVLLTGTPLSGIDFLKTGALLANLSGFVYADGPSEDGQFSVDDVPLPAVFIRLYADVNQDGSADIGDILISTTATSLDGSYEFTGLPGGDYLLVELDPPGVTSLHDVQGNPIDNTIAVELAGVGVAGRNFLDGNVIFSSIIGQSVDDADADGTLSAPDRALPGVRVRLYIDLAPDGELNAEDIYVGETVTDASGQFVFPGLVGGSYLLQEIDRAGATSTGDSTGGNDNLAVAQLATTDHTTAWFANAFDPTGYIYDAVTGEIVPGGQVAVSGPGAVTLILDGTDGQYVFETDGTPGTYTVSFMPPAGYLAAAIRPAESSTFDPTGIPDPASLGAGENPAAPGFLTTADAGNNPYFLTFELQAGDPRVINNNLPVVRQDSPTFTYWSASRPGTGGSATANLDGDLQPDLLEYAFQTDPQSGLAGSPRHGVEYDNVGNAFRAFYILREEGLEDVVVTVKVLADLTASPAGWVDAAGAVGSVSNGDGSRTYRIANLEAEPGFAGLEWGFVRFEVGLDADQNGTPETSIATETYGWQRRHLPAETVTWSQAFANPPSSAGLSGLITSVTGATLDLSQALGGSAAFPDALTANTYLEILDGPHAGHRLPVHLASSSGTTYGVDLASSRCTLTSLPTDTLPWSAFVLRSYPTLSASFNPAAFNSTNNPATADRIIAYNATTQSFNNYWLYAASGNPRWVREGDATLANQNGLIIDAANGVMVQRRHAALTLPNSGLVRTSPFVYKLAAGQNFLSNPWPLPASPSSRGMTVLNGFTGTAQATTSDQLSIWRADSTPGEQGYHSYFLLKAGTLERWVRQGDATLQNRSANELFMPGKAAFMKSVNGMSSYVVPVPWQP